MNINFILIAHGEPNSTFSEILFKYFSSIDFKKNKKKIILVGNKDLLYRQMKKLKYKLYLNEIYELKHAKKKLINIININYEFKKTFTKISSYSNNYIKKCFDLCLKILKKNKSIGFINGPISKKHFLKKKYPGITEYVASKTNTKKQTMLIYNEEISVSPITTHIPIKNVTKNINKKKIINTAIEVNKFYKKIIKKKPNIAILGLNPHCETTDIKSEEKNLILPAINYLKKKKLKVSGPHSADTFFLKKNIINYDVVLGMYHDQVLTPIKTLFEFNAINITLGLPFIRISPDHGPNYKMMGKNTSDPSSFFYAVNFLNKI